MDEIMNLAEKLNQYSREYWDFQDYRKEAPLVRYPAIMVAPMQECILREVINADRSIKNVLDPFVGSGTVLVEGQKLGLDVVGIDINPLAIMLTQVQLEGVPEDKIDRHNAELFARIVMLNGNVEHLNFTNVKKWFTDDVIASLSVIRQAIMGECDSRIRRFYWCCFAETVKKYSNTRTSTFKLHIKDEEHIASQIDDSIDFFKNHVIHQSKRYARADTCLSKHFLDCGDSKDILKEISSCSVDLICTSPPYGDNHTTVTYGQYSILPLLWIDPRDVDLWNPNILETFTAIDSLSLGGRVKRGDSKNYSKYVADISENKRKKITSFFEDYEAVFSQLARVLKPGKPMILTLGNRRVDNHEVVFDKFNDELAAKYGLEVDSTITRNIIGKRMPSKVSNLKDVGSVSSISTEYIKIYRKAK